MPKALTYAVRIPEALAELRESEQETVSRADVERLLGLHPRQAQALLLRAGATGGQGKESRLPTRDFILFFECVCPQAAAEERRRRRRVAEELTRTRQQWIERGGPLFVEVDSRKVEHVQRGGFAALPPGIRVETGKITIEFQDGREALDKLALLSVAIHKDLNWFLAHNQAPKQSEVA